MRGSCFSLSEGARGTSLQTPLILPESPSAGFLGAKYRGGRLSLRANPRP